MRSLKWLALGLAAAALLAPLAHVLELPNKLRLAGPLWLAVQQLLYDGWGPLLGGPTEIGAAAICLVLVAARWRDNRLRRLYALAAFANFAMLACFFLLNDPVNKAVSAWTVQTLPADWPAYRLRWEAGHALAFALGLVALATTGGAVVSPGGRQT
jgi:hypothetical protein